MTKENEDLSKMFSPSKPVLESNFLMTGSKCVLVDSSAGEQQGSGGGDQGKADLQKAFKDFQIKRKAEHKRNLELQRKKKEEQRTAARMAELRARFVEVIRSYIGVPYASRFHADENCECDGCKEAGEQLKQRPLFLDCCALIRRAVFDLQEEFGFRLGPGNQSYQFDTLPEQVDCLGCLEPGDLVFYEGEYFVEGKKRPVHDMVHVEVFVGGESGEGVIGSREKFKWVKEYDSYKFESKSWRLKRYYFCRITTWLEGTLKSFCAEHTWPVRSTRPMGKSSVFSVQDQCAGDSDGDDA